MILLSYQMLGVYVLTLPYAVTYIRVTLGQAQFKLSGIVCKLRLEQSIVPSCRSQLHRSGHTHAAPADDTRDTRFTITSKTINCSRDISGCTPPSSMFTSVLKMRPHVFTTKVFVILLRMSKSDFVLLSRAHHVPYI